MFEYYLLFNNLSFLKLFKLNWKLFYFLKFSISSQFPSWVAEMQRTRESEIQGSREPNRLLVCLVRDLRIWELWRAAKLTLENICQARLSQNISCQKLDCLTSVTLARQPCFLQTQHNLKNTFGFQWMATRTCTHLQDYPEWINNILYQKNFYELK